MTCPRCSADDVEGRFCGHCGALLEARNCPICDARVPSGHRYCAECGSEQGGLVAPTASGTAPSSAQARPALSAAPARPAPSSSASPAARSDLESTPRTGWMILGGAVLAGLLFLAVPYVWTGWSEGGGGERVPLGAQGPAQGSAEPGLGAAPNVDLSSMTPREAADRLFNRVMTALGEGDDAEAQNFLPMAIDAYELVPDLDPDGHFHLSLLQQAQGDHEGALQTSEAVISEEPDHLLSLYAAAEAARELGREELAREYHGHILEVFEAESARDLPEYREHESFLPTIRQVASDYMAGGG